MLASGPNNYNSQFAVANDGTIALSTTPFPIGGGTITGPVVIKTNTAPTLPAPLTGMVLQLGGVDGTPTRLEIDGFAQTGAVSFRRADGTAAVRTAVLSGEIIGSLGFSGYGATGYGERAYFNAGAAENWTDTSQGTFFHWSTTANGTLGAQERMRIDHNGNVGIGTTAPAQKLTVKVAADQNVGIASGGAAAAIAVLNDAGNTWMPLQVNASANCYICSAAGNVGIGTTTPGAKLEVKFAPDQRLQFMPGPGINVLNDAGNAWMPLSLSSAANCYLCSAAGNVGIGTTTPGARLVVSTNAAPTLPAAIPSGTVLQLSGADNTVSRFLVDGYGGGGVSPTIHMRASRGTAAAPSALQANDVLGYLLWNGYGATGYSAGNRALITALAAQNWTDTAQGAFLSFNTTLNGTATSVETMRIADSGYVGIGTTAPNNKLTVVGASTPASFANSGGGLFQISTGTGANTDNMLLFGVHDTDYSWIQAAKPGTDVRNLVLNSSGGRVGIGTISPNSLLSVAGAVSIESTQGFSLNGYYNGGWVYATAGTMGAMSVNPFGYTFYVAPTGAAGASAPLISALTIGSNGGLSLGATYSSTYIPPANGLMVQGNTGLGLPGPANRLSVFGQTGAGPPNPMCIMSGPAGADSATTMLQFSDGGYTITVGAITRNGSNTVNYGTASDVRLKNEINNTETGLEALMKLKVCDFVFIGDDDRKHGLIAQEVMEVYPWAVRAGGESANMEPWLLDYGRLTPLIIRAMQQQQAEIQLQQARIETLENMVMKGSA
jgi:hypothetical protein